MVAALNSPDRVIRIAGFSILTRQSDRAGRSVWIMAEGGAVILGLLGWTFWFICVAYRLWTKTSETATTGVPAGALAEYLEYIRRFWEGAPIYVAADLHGFHYLPSC